jgi:hypothetical protein
MPSHDYHEGAPNYNQHQLYYDGCDECKFRAAGQYPFEKVDLKFAWGRAVRFEQGRLDPAEQPISEAEAPVLRLLWSLIVQLERHGIPLGQFPGETAQILREMIREKRAADLAREVDVDCPRNCGIAIHVTLADIDSSLRKHLEYCNIPDPEDNGN